MKSSGWKRWINLNLRLLVRWKFGAEFVKTILSRGCFFIGAFVDWGLGQHEQMQYHDIVEVENVTASSSCVYSAGCLVRDRLQGAKGAPCFWILIRAVPSSDRGPLPTWGKRREAEVQMRWKKILAAARIRSYPARKVRPTAVTASRDRRRAELRLLAAYRRQTTSTMCWGCWDTDWSSALRTSKFENSNRKSENLINRIPIHEHALSVRNI